MKIIQIFTFVIFTHFFSSVLAEDSTIVFMRSSFYGSAIKASVYDVTEEETKFLGILKNKKKSNTK